MSREIVGTRVRCDLCKDAEVLIGTSDVRRVDGLLTRFHELQVGADDECLECLNDAAAEYDEQTSA